MRMLFSTILFALVLFPSRLSAEGSPILRRTTEALAPARAKLNPKPEITFDDNGKTLVISYLPQSDKIHGRLVTGMRKS